MSLQRVRLLVLRGGAIGDFILSLPVIQALRERWPGAYIELIGYPHVANLALAAGLVDRVDSLDRAEIARFFALKPMFTPEQAEHIQSFDLIVSFLHDPDGSVRQNLEAAGAVQLISASPLVASGHATDHFLRALEKLAIYSQGALPRLTLGSGAAAKGGQWLYSKGLRRAIAIHPGSGSPKKNWPAARFLEAARILRERGRHAFFVFGEADGEAARAVAAAHPEAAVLSDTPLLDVASVLSACEAYLGNDSGLTHVAAAIGLPVVALFGPTDPDVWGPRGPHVRIVRAPGGDLQALSVEDVLARLPL